MATIHKDLAEWYRALHIEPTGEVLPKRWAGVVAFDGSSTEIVSLTRLFYGLGKPGSEFLSAFRAPFQTADAAFPMQKNDQELVVLAGAKLIHFIESYQKEVACTAALSLICGAAQNLRKAAPIADILEKAAKYLNESAANRASEEDSDEQHNNSKAACEAIKAQGEPLKGFASAFEHLLDEHRALKLRMPVIAEESNMLWWLFSEYSRDLKKPWIKLSVPASALVAGKELADLTLVIPGPIAAAAFLDKAIRRNGTKSMAKISIKEALIETPLEWRQKLASQTYPAELLDLMPLFKGVRSSVSAPDDSWVAAFDQGAGFSADSKLSPHQLAYQFYLETLLCRSWTALA